MGVIKWIKIDTGLFNNRKIKVIERMDNGDSIIVIWLRLLILAAENNDSGAIYITDEIAYSDEDLATLCGRDVTIIRKALDTFLRYKMITRDESGFIYIENWDEYQNIDGMERIREQNRLRKQRQRERERDAECDSHTESRDSHAIDKDIDKEVDKNNIKRATPFKPPTLEEVKAYCLERNNGIDPQIFIDFYDSKGWMIGKNKVKDWRACMRTWENRRNADSKPKKTQLHDFEQNKYDFNDLERKLLQG